MRQVIKKHFLRWYDDCIVHFCIIIWEYSNFHQKRALFDHVSKKNAGLPSDNAKFDNAIDIFFKDVFFSDLAHLGKL